MIGYLTLILVCQLVGELAVGALALPIPGPVLGMVVLLVYLFLRGEVSKELEETTDGLLRAMSLLFVPAGTGVMMHFKLLGEALVPLAVAVAISTITAIVVTALMMRWLDKGRDDA
ncbi:CidA/LrgA family protein [Arenibacterium sp. CAU 1754]